MEVKTILTLSKIFYKLIYFFSVEHTPPYISIGIGETFFWGIIHRKIYSLPNRQKYWGRDQAE